MPNPGLAWVRLELTTRRISESASEIAIYLVTLLQDAGISWRAYAEPDFGSPVYDVCPLDFTYLDVEHLAFVYFSDVNEGLSKHSKECIDNVRP